MPAMFGIRGSAAAWTCNWNITGTHLLALSQVPEGSENPHALVAIFLVGHAPAYCYRNKDRPVAQHFAVASCPAGFIQDTYLIYAKHHSGFGGHCNKTGDEGTSTGCTRRRSLGGQLRRLPSDIQPPAPHTSFNISTVSGSTRRSSVPRKRRALPHRHCASSDP